MIVIAREQARLLPATRKLGHMGKVRGIVVHCTEGRRPKNEADAMAAWRAAQAWHQEGKGWPDIAYHGGFNDLGMVLRGRHDDCTGAHAKGRNTEALGFVWQGKAHETPTTEAFKALQWLIEEADRTHGPGLYVIGHRDVSRKPCPGDAIYAWLLEHYGARNPYQGAA